MFEFSGASLWDSVHCKDGESFQPEGKHEGVVFDFLKPVQRMWIMGFAIFTKEHTYLCMLIIICKSTSSLAWGEGDKHKLEAKCKQAMFLTKQ